MPAHRALLNRRRFLRLSSLAVGTALLKSSRHLMAAEPATPFPVSDHCDGFKFFNPRRHVNRGWHEVLRWKLSSTPAPWPESVAITPAKPGPHPGAGRLAAHWINHATFLLQTSAGNVLTDPVFSDRVSPVGWVGPRRVHLPGIAFADLPPIDVVLLSHDHFDHCDLASLALLAKAHAPLAVTLLGNGPLLRAAGFAPEKVIELDWWGAHTTAAGLAITATPARHWSNRVKGSRNGRLWGGFRLAVGDRSAHFVGDTGYDDVMFREIRERCGAADLAMVPIGAYEPRWFMADQHCNPAESVLIHRDLGAKTSLGMHWGTFQLTDEAREEPVNALAAALAAAQLPPTAFRALAPGENVVV